MVPAPFSWQELAVVRRRVLSRAEQLGLGLLIRLPDGSGFSVRFRTAQDRDNAIAALAVMAASPLDPGDVGGAFAVLRSAIGEPTVRIDDNLGFFTPY